MERNAVMVGDLKITDKRTKEFGKRAPRTVSRNLTYELNGVDIGSKIRKLVLTIEAGEVVSAEITFFVTSVDVDISDVDILMKLREERFDDTSLVDSVLGEHEVLV